MYGKRVCPKSSLFLEKTLFQFTTLLPPKTLKWTRPANRLVLFAAFEQLRTGWKQRDFTSQEAVRLWRQVFRKAPAATGSTRILFYIVNYNCKISLYVCLVVVTIKKLCKQNRRFSLIILKQLSKTIVSFSVTKKRNRISLQWSRISINPLAPEFSIFRFFSF